MLLVLPGQHILQKYIVKLSLALELGKEKKEVNILFEKILKRKGSHNQASRRFFAGLIAIVVCAVSILALGPAGTGSVKAADSDFEIDDEGMITGYNPSSPVADVVIPSEIDGIEVTGIDAWVFDESAEFTSITIPATVTSIEGGAFSVPSLEKVTFLGAIPEYPPLSEIFEIVYGQTITIYCYLEHYMAYDGDISDFEWELLDEGSEEPDTPPASDNFKIEGGKLTGYTETVRDGKVTITIPDNVTVIGANAFKNKFLKQAEVTVVLPSTVTTIEDSAFEECFGLVSIEFPSSLTSIGKKAFYGCEKLTNVTFPAGLQTIADSAFLSCSGLTSVSIPAGTNVTLTTAMTTFAFAMCDKVQSFTVAAGNTQLSAKDGVLYDKAGTTLLAYPLGSKAESFAIPEGTITIGREAFKQHQQRQNCALKNVGFPESLETIENNAFMSQNLTSVTIPGDFKLGTGVFQLNNSIKTVNVAEGVTEITDMLFYGLEGVETINLPSTLETIGYRAFDRCGASSIKLPEGLKSIGEEAFESSKLKSVEIPASVTNIGDRAFYNCKEMAAITFKAGSGSLNLGRYTFNNCAKLNNIVVPSRVTKLDDGVFSKMGALTTITLPNSIKTLGNNVFASSDALKTVKLPDSITEMGNGTFRSCHALESITLPANLAKLGTCTFEIEEGANTSLTKVVIPDSVKITTVPSDTFWGREGIKELYLPASIAGTEACAFSKCSDELVINIARKSSEFTRSMFDCFDFDGAELNGYWDGDAYVYSEEQIDWNPSKDADEELAALNKESDKTTASLDGAVLKSRSSASMIAACGCASGTGGRFTASAKPTFNYGKASSSSTVAGQNGNGTSSSSNTSSKASSNKAAANNKKSGGISTGDTAAIFGTILVLILSGLYLVNRYRRAYRR